MIYRHVAIYLAFFTLGALSAYPFYKNFNASVHYQTIREDVSGYQFIKPFLVTDDTHLKPNGSASLSAKLSDIIDQSKSEDLATDASVYYRDFNTSTWVGVNESDNYEPSSLVKIITLIAYLKIAEQDSEILNQELQYRYHEDPGQTYKPKTRLSDGPHSVKELLIEMIIDSDQDAMKILNSYRPDKIAQVFKDLQLPLPTAISIDYMSAEIVSRIFRVLINATYLTRSYSEEALKLLSFTTFNQGIVAGVQASTTISHKFGEHTFVDPQGKLLWRELHDCGIVYYPNHPYLLCVMTKGTDFVKLESVIEKISSAVYSSI